MGLFDAFGVGGGSVTLQLQTPTVQPGGVVAGVITFTAGKRGQAIQAMKLRLSRALHGGKGGAPQTDDIVPEYVLSGGFSAQGGQQFQFPFEFQLPVGLPGSVPGSVHYHLHASADISGEIDPGAHAEITVLDGGKGGYDDPYAAKQGFVQDPYAAKQGYADPAYAKQGYEDPAYAKQGYAKQGYAGGKGGGVAPGEHCVAPWDNGQLYGATVVENNGSQCLVQWDDGSAASWVDAGQVMPG